MEHTRFQTGCSISTDTHINIHKCRQVEMVAHMWATPHMATDSFIKRKIAVFPDVAPFLLWTRGARAASNMNAAVVHFTTRIKLMYWATKFKDTSQAVVGEHLMLQSSKKKLRLFLDKPVLLNPSFIILPNYLNQEHSDEVLNISSARQDLFVSSWTLNKCWHFGLVLQASYQSWA